MDGVKKASFNIPREEVFLYWLNFTQPLHKLSKTNIKVLSEILKLRFDLSEKVKDDEMLDEFTLSTKSRAKLMSKLNLTVERFNNILSTLRKHKVIVGHRINKAYIPDINKSSKKYSVLFELILK